MRRIQITLTAIALVILSAYLVRAQQVAQAPAKKLPAGAPEWAYGYGPPPPPRPTEARPQPATTPRVDDGTTLKRIPGSNVALKMSLFTRTTEDDGVKEVPDWYPEEHRPMPDIVKFGRKIVNSQGVWDGKEGIRACGFCHVANGRGRSENAGPAGLSVAYILQQMEDMRNGLRGSSDPAKENARRMASFAKLMTPEETKAAAEYFASLPFPTWVKVVEANTVPKTRSAGGMFVPLEGAAAGEEPLGQRIIEVPQHPDLTDLRDGHSGFIAYVPFGSIAKGDALVTQADCVSCHGPKLTGVGPVPPIAGRSPSYIARQMFDFQTGARHGLVSNYMKPLVANMTTEDMLNIAAYVASRDPSGEVTPQARLR